MLLHVNNGDFLTGATVDKCLLIRLKLGLPLHKKAVVLKYIVTKFILNFSCNDVQNVCSWDHIAEAKMCPF